MNLHLRLTQDPWVRMIAGIACMGIIAARAGAGDLPARAKAAIAENFPGTKVLGIDKEKEFGATYYQVLLQKAGKRTELEVSSDGVLGEAESRVRMSSLPKVVSSAIQKQLAGKKIVKIEKHVRHGSAKSGSWVQLSSPKTFYDVKYQQGQHRKSVLFNARGKPARDLDDPDENDDDNQGDDNSGKNDDNEDDDAIAIKSLPGPVSAAIASKFPGASLKRAQRDTDDNKTVYEVKFTHAKNLFEAKVDPNGKILRVKQELSARDLPKTVAKTLQQKYPRARIMEVEKKTNGKTSVYEVELKVGPEKIDATISSSGKVIKAEVDNEDDGDDDDAGDDNGDDD